ncbi:hypothetical protein Mapa_003495 [Marchantia paleacea]|nr:hypothetical protein Mapa_003495 [Marchantia paleacea]
MSPALTDDEGLEEEAGPESRPKALAVEGLDESVGEGGPRSIPTALAVEGRLVGESMMERTLEDSGGGGKGSGGGGGGRRRWGRSRRGRLPRAVAYHQIRMRVLLPTGERADMAPARERIQHLQGGVERPRHVRHQRTTLALHGLPSERSMRRRRRAGDFLQILFLRDNLLVGSTGQPTERRTDHPSIHRASRPPSPPSIDRSS